MSHDLPLLDDFSGTARLFPLPNLVLFPHVAQPLHIFEPRYRQMMADALADDRLLAMALLQPGHESEYHQAPPIHATVCVGRILQEERLADGRYNLLLQGLCRARVRAELATDRLYRTARVDLLAEEPVASPSSEAVLRQDLGRGVTPFFADHAPALEQMRRLLASGLPLGSLCDVFAFALPLEVDLKQRLLDEVRVEQRVRLLLDGLEVKAPPPVEEAPPRRFPPDFSAN